MTGIMNIITSMKKQFAMKTNLSDKAGNQEAKVEAASRRFKGAGELMRRDAASTFLLSFLLLMSAIFPVGSLSGAGEGDNLGVVADSQLDFITGTAPISYEQYYNMVDAISLRDIAIAPDNKRLYGITYDSWVYAWDIDLSGDAPDFEAVSGSPVDLSGYMYRSRYIEVGKDGRTVYVGGIGGVVSVNVADRYEMSGTSDIPYAPFTWIVDYPLEGEDPDGDDWDLTDGEIVGMRIHPDGDKIIAVIGGPRWISEDGEYDDFGFITQLNISDDVKRSDFEHPGWDPPFEFPWPFFDLTYLTLSPDGNYGLLVANGAQMPKATPFGSLPNPDEETAAVLVIDLNSLTPMAAIPTTIKGENTQRIRQEILQKSIGIVHPKVAIYQIYKVQDEARSLFTGLSGLDGGLGAFMQLEAANNDYILHTYRQIYKDFGTMSAYAYMYPTDMVAPTAAAINHRGDMGLVSFQDTNNLGFLHLKPSNDLRGYSAGNVPDFYFVAATDKTVSGLNLDVGVEGGNINWMPRNSWLNIQDIHFTSDDSHAYIGMDGGLPSWGTFKNFFAYMIMNNVRQDLSQRSSYLSKNEAISSGHMRLVNGNAEDGTDFYFASPRQVATFQALDSDGDSISDHVEAFNRFNDFKPIVFGDRTQLVSMNDYDISDPSTSRVISVFPVDYTDKGFLLPHSGLGYRFNYNGHLNYSVNVGSATVVSTIEDIGRRWHEDYVDEEITRPYFVVLDMSHAGEGLVQNEEGEYRHFDPRNGYQANFQYLQQDSDRPFEFVLSNGPTSPTDNSELNDTGRVDLVHMQKLMDMLLEETTVKKIAIDPGLADLLPYLKNEKKVEIHGSTKAGQEFTRRDLDAYFKVVFQPEAGIGVSIDGLGDLVESYDGTGESRLVSINLEESGTDQALPFTLDFNIEDAAYVTLTGSHEIYLDRGLTRMLTGDTILRVSEINGALWLKVSDYSSLEITVQAYDDEMVALTSFTYNADTLLLDLDVGEGIVQIDEVDADGDRVPDYADGYNLDNLTGGGDVDNNRIWDNSDDIASNVFLPITIKIDGSMDFSQDPVLHFDYDVSIPSRVARWKAGSRNRQLLFYYELPATGTLRLWTRPGDEARTLQDFIAPGSHALSTFGLTGPGEITLYVEAVHEVLLNEITVSIDPDGYDGPVSFLARDRETVRTAGESFNITIDSNNDGSINEADDLVEDVDNDPSLPGHILLVNNAGDAGNGKPAYLNYASGTQQEFAQLHIQLPDVIDEDTATFSINYSASDPRAVVDTGINGFHVLPPGHLRIWKNDGLYGRTVEDDFLAPGTYQLSDLPSDGILYVEGILPSSDVSDQVITVQFNPGVFRNIKIELPGVQGLTVDRNIIPQGYYQDSVRLTVYEQRFENNFASDARFRKVDINGQPLLDPEPQDELEEDSAKRGFYIDPYSRTPVFSLADLSIPLKGENLKMEFRRTAGISAFQTVAGDPDTPVNPVAEDNILGTGWRTNLGMRVIRKNGVYTIYDDNGQAHRYNAGGQPMPHSFQENSTHRTELKLIANEENADIIDAVIWTRNFWSQYIFTGYNPDPGQFGNRSIEGQLFRLHEIVDNNGNTIKFKYENEGDAYPSEIFEKGLEAKKMQFTYVQAGNLGLRLEELTDPNGNVYKYIYSGGNLSDVYFPDPDAAVGSTASGNTRESYEYETSFSQTYEDNTQTSFIGLKKITNPNGNIIELDYEMVDRNMTAYEDNVKALGLTEIRTAVGSSLQKSSTFTVVDSTPYYSELSIRDFQNTVWTWEFNTAVIPSSVKNGLGYSFNAFIIPVLDDYKRRATLDEIGELEWTYNFSNDAYCNLEMVTDGYGNNRSFEYGEVDGFNHTRYGRPSVKTVDPILPEEYLAGGGNDRFDLRSEFEYNFASRKLKKEKKPNYFDDEVAHKPEIKHTYDDKHNLISMEMTITGSDGVTRTSTTTYNYDASGFMNRMVDPDGRLTSMGRSVKTDGWIDVTTVYKEASSVPAWDANPASFTEFYKTSREYDLNGNLVKEIIQYEDPDNPGSLLSSVSVHEVDAANNRIRTTLPGIEILPSTEFPDTGEIVYHYDGMGNLLQQIDARGVVTNFQYDERENQTVHATNTGNGQVVRYEAEYFANGMLKSEASPMGAVTEYTCDELNRRTQADFTGSYTDIEGENKSISTVVKWEYRQNSGGYCFSSDEFAPTFESNERGIATEIVYDKAYRVEKRHLYYNPAPGGSSALSATPAKDIIVQYEYDDNGNVITETTLNPSGAGNQVEEMEYDELDRVISKTSYADGVPLEYSYVYDKAGHVVKVQDPEDGVVLTEYNPLGLPVAEVVRMNGDLNFVTQGLNEFVIPRGALDPEDIVTFRDFDGRGKLVKETFRRFTDHTQTTLQDIITEFRYDALGNLIKRIGNSDGNPEDGLDERVEKFVYDYNGNLRQRQLRRESVQNPESFISIVTEYQYDGMNRETLVRDDLVLDGENGGMVHPELTREYDPNGNIIREINARGQITDYYYDSLDRQIGMILHAQGISDDIYTAFEYSLTGSLTRKLTRYQADVDSPGSWEDIEFTAVYDNFDRAVEMRGPLGHSEYKTYDNLGNILQTTDVRGGVTDYEYDTLGRLLTRTFPETLCSTPGTAGSPAPARPVIVRAYDGLGRILSQTDLNGYEFRYEYDAAGRMISMTNPEENTQYTAYDQAGNVLSETNYREYTYKHTYDALNRRITTADPKSKVTQMFYDFADNVIREVDPLGRTAVFRYDVLNRKVEEQVHGTGTAIQYSYTLNGGMAGMTDENGVSTTYFYDAFDRLIEARNDAGISIHSFYDSQHNYVKTIDGAGQVTAYVYDKLGRIRERRESMGKTTVYEYDEAGNNTKIIDALGDETIFTYDPLDRLTSRTLPTGKTFSFDYDRGMNIVRVKTPNGDDIVQLFDEMNRVIGRSYPNHDFVFEWDANSNMTSAIHTVAVLGSGDEIFTNDFTYDERDLLLTKTVSMPGSASRTVEYDYDDSLNIDTVTTPGGRTIEYDYNGRNDITGIFMSTASNPVGSLYSYDDGGRLTGFQYTNNTSAGFTYNNRNLLVDMVHVNIGNGKTILINENRYNNANFREFEKEIYDRQSNDDVVAYADVYQYDALHRVTGVLYKADAVRTANISAGNLPVSPGSYEALQSQNLGEDRYTFDLLHNRIQAQKQGYITNYNTDGNGNYFKDPYNRINNYDATPYDTYDPVFDQLVFAGFGDGMPGTVQEGDSGIGEGRNLYYFDANDNGGFDFGEDLWGDLGGSSNVFDPETDTLLPFFRDQEDTIVFDGLAPDGDPQNGALVPELSHGTSFGLYFRDENANSLYDNLEDFWIEDGSSGIGYWNPGEDKTVVFYNSNYDSPVYNGAVPEVPDGGLQDINLPEGSAGANQNLYYHDANGNQEHDSGEDIWVSNSGSGYDAVQSQLIYTGDDGTQVVDGVTAGIMDNLFHLDSNGNGSWDEDEAIWKNASMAPDLVGVTGSLFFHDANNNLAWDAGEPFWANAILGGSVGRQEGIYFSDNNGNGIWDPNEGIWSNDSGLSGEPYDADLVWDDNGNLLSHREFSYTWTAENQLETVSEDGVLVVQYVYDDGGDRVAKIFADGSRTYFYNSLREVLVETDQNGLITREYLPGRKIDEPVAMVQNGNTYYFHSNTLGSVAAISDADGDVVERYRYDVYGNYRILNPDGQVRAGVSVAFSPYLFTGRRVDSESELYYFRARCYSPDLGRFISPDPMDYINGMNVYAYVAGNVVNMVDPMGQFRMLASLLRGISSASRFLFRAGSFLIRGGINLMRRGVASLGRFLQSRVLGGLRNFMSRARTAISSWSRNLRDFASKSWSGAIRRLGDLKQGIQQFARGALGRTQNILSSAFSKSWNMVKAVANKVTQLAGNALKMTKNFLKSTWDKTKNFFSSKWEKTKDFFSKKWDKLKTGVKSKWDKFRTRTKKDEAFFWSGRTDDVGGQHVAKKIADREGGTTLEMLIEKRGIKMPKWDPKNPASVKAWENISEQFASGVSGHVRAVVGKNLRAGNIWETKELPRLMSNPLVKSITIIDPKTFARTLIFRR